MADSDSLAHVRHVGILAPMRPELDPIVRRLHLTDRGRGDGADGRIYSGDVGGITVTAMLTEIGMANAAKAAHAILDHGVDAVFVVGIAGSVDRSLGMGELIMPERVVERATGREHRPTIVGTHRPHGTLSCGDDLITDVTTLDAMASEGIVAVDMETAAVATLCEDAGRPWSVFRAISDYAGSGFLDEALLALISSDGTMEQEAVAQFLAENPERVDALTQFGKDSERATEAAAEAAASALRTLANR